MSLWVTTLAVCLALGSRRSFVDTAPLNEGPADDSISVQDSSVRELENLKNVLGKTVSMMQTQSEVITNNNGLKETHAERKEEVDKNGRLIAQVSQHLDVESKGEKSVGKIQTDVVIPSQGIHKSVVQQLPTEYQKGNINRRSSLDGFQESGNNLDKFNVLNGIQYSPLDMAEYVFWTGDEKGVTLAIEEFLQEGLMSKEEAISFLQEIKYNLDYLKNHYIQLGLNAKEPSKPQETVKYSNFKAERPELKSSFDLNQLRQEVNKKADLGRTHSVVAPMKLAAAIPSDADRSQDEDYDELLERLRLADFLYTEYSLEEVIYQLAKVMFTQSLTRGSAEAQQALQKFTNFLEMEAEQGRISRTLEKKVLDVLIASLSDTLAEHPELLAAAKENVGQVLPKTEGQHFLRQILQASPNDKLRAGLPSYKTQNAKTIQEMKINNHLPLGLGNYKNP